MASCRNMLRLGSCHASVCSKQSVFHLFSVLIMGKFLKRIALLVTLPVLLLLGVYLLTDPFTMLKPFSLQYFDPTNRDYMSTELFLKNYPSQKYDSYVFASSRGCGINTYHWLKYLPQGSRQYMFQAWSETVTGINQKITYIDKIGGDIKNAIVLIDIPGSFAEPQLSKSALAIKDYKMSGQSKFSFYSILFWDFLQKPSLWYSSVINWFQKEVPVIGFDTISNDWEKSNATSNLSAIPPKDSLSNCSAIVKTTFLQEATMYSESDIVESDPLISTNIQEQLLNIKSIFDKHGTDYKIIISPAYCYKHPTINCEDLAFLFSTFGKDNVFNYSGKNELTSDCYNFSDPNHFGLSVGWQIIEDIYNNTETPYSK